MKLESERKLKYDSRLRSRRGWISDEELQAELDQLPDAADNVYVPEDEGETPRAPAGEPPAAGPTA